MSLWHHMAICAGLVVVGVVLVSAGLDALALLPAVGCVLMMVAMMAMMGGHGGGSGKEH